MAVGTADLDACPPAASGRENTATTGYVLDDAIDAVLRACRFPQVRERVVVAVGVYVVDVAGWEATVRDEIREAMRLVPHATDGDDTVSTVIDRARNLPCVLRVPCMVSFAGSSLPKQIASLGVVA